MIQPNELTIGNLIYDNFGSVAKVEIISNECGVQLSTTQHYVDSLSDSHDYEECNGIPLTSGILENLQPWQLRKIKDLLIENSFPLTVKQTYKKIETLHCLQNFYFFATDEELMVNELEYAKMKNNEI